MDVGAMNGVGVEIWEWMSRKVSMSIERTKVSYSIGEPFRRVEAKKTIADGRFANPRFPQQDNNFHCFLFRMNHICSNLFPSAGRPVSMYRIF